MKLLAVATAAAILSGCAALVHGPTQTVNVVTDPPGAECTIGRFKVTSPAVVTLERSYSLPDAEIKSPDEQTYYLPAGATSVAVKPPTAHSAPAPSPDGYPVECRLPGYTPIEGTLMTKTDWGFVVADVFFGGIIGGLLVDYTFGDSGYYLSPDVLTLHFAAATPASVAPK